MSQTNTEIPVVQKIKISRKKKNIVVETPVVEEPPVVELNDFIQDENEDDDIDVKIQLTEEQLKELQKQKKEKELRNNIVALRTTAMEICEAKRQDILTKIQALQQEQLALQDVRMSISNGEMDEEIIAEELNKKEKTKKEKKQPTYEGTGKKAGTGNTRLKEIEDMNAGKLNDKITHSKTINGKEWSILFEGRKRDGGIPVYKCCDTDEYFMPLFKEVAELTGVKLKEDYFEWVKN